MLYLLAIILLFAFALNIIINLLPEAPSPVEKLSKGQWHITNIVLGQKTMDVYMPIELKYFEIFNISGNYITDVFTQDYDNQTLYSFLLHGKTFHDNWSLSNPIPGRRLFSETEIRCWFGKLPIALPDAEIFYRHAPQDVSPFCTKKIFSSGISEWDQKYVFAGDPKFVSFLSPALINWIEKNRLYIMISSGWMLLLDVKRLSIPNDVNTWQNQMQDMSVWISLKDILSQKI